MKLKTLFLNIVLLGSSVLASLAVCELGARLVLRPADYLSVDMVRDPILGGVPSAGTLNHGFDSWGFRNASVPKTADIVVIGDSQTYGNTATMDDSWPYALGRLAKARVYNMALGGYGPNQYYYLLKTKALSLKPRLIIVGLSMSDDFDNAYGMTYGFDHWSSWRSRSDVRVDVNTWDADPTPTKFTRIRNWFARNSVLYQIVFHGPVLGWLTGKVEIRNAHRADARATALFVPEKHIEEAFQPSGNLRRLDQQSDTVREGMRLTFRFLQEMNSICRQNHIGFMVAVIPTKEMVFSRYLEHNANIPLHDVVDKLLVNERLALDKTFKFLSDSGIPYADPLPALQSSSDHQLFARSSGDMHPNKNGYRVIAESVFHVLHDGAIQASLTQ